jgi:hypothetical protein
MPCPGEQACKGRLDLLAVVAGQDRKSLSDPVDDPRRKRFG